MKYQIVVPSRGRPDNCKTLLAMMPDAYICVDEREQKDYAPHVPKKQLLVHPKSSGAPAARNWIIRNTTAPCLIQSDDDLVGVRCNVGSKRFLTDPDEVMAIIENAVTCCADLKLTTFCFMSCRTSKARRCATCSIAKNKFRSSERSISSGKSRPRSTTPMRTT